MLRGIFVGEGPPETCLPRTPGARRRRWFTPLHARVPYMQKHLFPSKAGSYCRTFCGETPIAVEGQARRARQLRISIAATAEPPAGRPPLQLLDHHRHQG